MEERVHKVCGDVEIVPRVVPAGGRGWEARVEVVFRDAEGQSLSGSQAVQPGCTFGSSRETMDAALLHGQHLLHEWVRGSAPQAEVTT